MRTIISDAIFAILLSVALFHSCSKSDVIMREGKAIEPYYPRTKSDSTATEDTSRTPITFTVEVEGWKEITINE